MSNRRRTTQPSRPSVPQSEKLLLVHGSDELNVLRLDKVIRESRWPCEVIILSTLPGLGRTMIEKFEQAAIGVGYAIALVTPDDFVTFGEEQYLQARPNVAFELGWFFGRLGRSQVCILFKRGTKLPSDLDGITRIEFDDNVVDVFHKLKVEMESAGMLKSA